MVAFWIFVFIISAAALVKGSHWFLHGAERIGLRFGLSPFVIGALIVALGTSFPELISSLAAIWQGVPEVVVANVVGSNITNVFLVLGIVAIVGRKLVVSKNLIDLELPLLAISTVLFLGIIYDGMVTFIEALLLFVAYAIYVLYAVSEEKEDINPVIEEQAARVRKMAQERWWGFSRLINGFIAQKDYVLFAVGIVAVIIGAKYLIESVIALAEIWDILPGIIAITAVALGTSLPELAVSTRAVVERKPEVAIGNILGSNAFNALMVIGIPGLITALPVDAPTMTTGIPIMALATLLLIIVGISRQIYHWEGMMFLILYAFFILKLFQII